MAEQSVTLGPGESKQVSFEAIPHEAKTYQVSVDGLIGSFKAIAPPGVLLRFTNPQKAATLWDAWGYDTATGGYFGSDPSGIREVAIPKTLKPPTTTFLLWIQEFNPAIPGPYNFGPYLVTIPEFGEYTWNSKDGKIDGISTINLPATNNESDIVGVISGFSWVDAYTPWACTLTIEEVRPVNGKDSWAQFFPSIYCYEARLPLDTIGQPLLKKGARVTCKARIKWGEYAAHWEAWDFHPVRPYPDEAYQFGGYVRYTIHPRVPYEMRVFVDLSYAVSGTVSPFAAVLVQWGRFGYPIGTWPIGGPSSGTLKDINTWHGNVFVIYANPNPQKPFHWNLLPVDDWVAAASANVVEWNQWAIG